MNNLTDVRFGNLIATHRSGTRHRCALWSCKCDCGGVYEATSVSLRNRTTTHCGCLATANRARAATSHGHYAGDKESRTMKSWRSMRQRCNNENSPDYPRYGGRGITICSRWDVFENFLADMGLRPPGKTLDRIYNDLNYEPNNCVWSTPIEQANNRRRRKKS